MSQENEAARDPIPFGYAEKSLDRTLPTEAGGGETVSSYAEYMERRGYEPLCFDNSAQDCWVILSTY